MVKIAIHHRENSFSERWINYCEENKINYQLVNCFDDDIILTLKEDGFTHLMWHLNHSSSRDLMVYPYIMNSADKIGIKTFPDFHTRWHFDNKIAQKYLLEAIEAPMVNSYVFYDKDKALQDINRQKFPLVVKLKRGAGATNVKLLHSRKDAETYINKMFSEGVSSTSGALGNLDKKIRIAKKIKNPRLLVKKLVEHLRKSRKEQILRETEKGYFYYQEFLPNNNYDTRIIIVGEIAFGIRRFTRKNDFRASGSGLIDYSSDIIDRDMVKIAFEVAEKLKNQSIAFDFVYDQNRNPKIIEICFGFSMRAYDKCEGYWNEKLEFNKGEFNPQFIMIENFLNEK